MIGLPVISAGREAKAMWGIGKPSRRPEGAGNATLRAAPLAASDRRHGPLVTAGTVSSRKRRQAVTMGSYHRRLVLTPDAIKVAPGQAAPVGMAWRRSHRLVEGKTQVAIIPGQRVGGAIGGAGLGMSASRLGR